MKRRFGSILAALAVNLCAVVTVLGQATQPAEAHKSTESTPLPATPNYSGDPWTRSTLTGAAGLWPGGFFTL